MGVISSRPLSYGCQPCALELSPLCGTPSAWDRHWCFACLSHVLRLRLGGPSCLARRPSGYVKEVPVGSGLIVPGAACLVISPSGGWALKAVPVGFGCGFLVGFVSRLS